MCFLKKNGKVSHSWHVSCRKRALASRDARHNVVVKMKLHTETEYDMVVERPLLSKNALQLFSGNLQVALIMTTEQCRHSALEIRSLHFLPSNVVTAVQGSGLTKTWELCLLWWGELLSADVPDSTALTLVGLLIHTVAETEAALRVAAEEIGGRKRVWYFREELL